jgi:hypothetical protein
MQPHDEFPDFDTRTPSGARMYDYALGGKDNYQADRQALETLEDLLPGTFVEARNNRKFLERVVTYLVGECGIRQIIDNGSGLPTQHNVHEVAQGIDPATRVVYIDNDPVVLRHQKVSALIASDNSTAFLLEDARNVDVVLGHPETQRLIDFDEPVAVLYLSFLHFIPDSDDPRGMIRRAMDRMAPGSYLVISHAASDDADKRAELNEFFTRVTGGHYGRVRETSEVREFFDGLEIAEPGLGRVAGWREEIPGELQGLKAYEYGGVGRKPA